MTYFPPITQDALVRAVLRLQLGTDGEDGLPDLEEALALAAQAHVAAIDGMDADQDRPQGWTDLQEAAQAPDDEDAQWVSGSTHPVGFKLTDGGTGHIRSYVEWALWKGGVDEPLRSQLMHELWSGIRPGTVAAANMDLKLQRDHRDIDWQRADEERLLNQLRASQRKIRELADEKLVGND